MSVKLIIFSFLALSLINCNSAKEEISAFSSLTPSVQPVPILTLEEYNEKITIDHTIEDFEEKK